MSLAKYLNAPLVSVVVITYNSSKYILETLESARSQTYQNIELIVSDDCSTDNTVELCRDWLSKNNERFKNTFVIQSEINKGIPANCNQGLSVSTGSWVKILGGDDILLPNCIELNIDFVIDHSNVNIVISKFLFFTNQKGVNVVASKMPYLKRHFTFFTLDSKSQYKFLLFRSFNIAPSAFIKKEILDCYKGFDEKYKYIEDLPFWLKITCQGVKIFYMDVETVLYRSDEASITRKEGVFYNIKFFKYYWEVLEDLVLPNFKWWNFLFWNQYYVERFRYSIIIYIFKNKKNTISRIFFRLIGYFRLSALLDALKNKLISIKWHGQHYSSNL
jgi:alpha-1,3-rhamnosyltransferase